MTRSWTFEDPEEQALGERFLKDGVVVSDAEDRPALDAIRNQIVVLAATHLGLSEPNDPAVFLEKIHDRVDPSRLNDLRLAVIQGLNGEPWVRKAYFALARNTLKALVGNELAMQLRLNLSIQMPHDTSSVLPLHADVWNGDSPFEVVLWTPFVDCRASQSMFLLPPELSAKHSLNMAKFASTEELYKAVERDLHWMDIDYGQTMIFSQNLMHGNRVNRESGTRWSINCRFKGVFTPYADKRLGEFFEPITLRPATRMGDAFSFPGGFDG